MKVLGLWGNNAWFTIFTMLYYHLFMGIILGVNVLALLVSVLLIGLIAEDSIKTTLFPWNVTKTLTITRTATSIITKMETLTTTIVKELYSTITKLATLTTTSLITLMTTSYSKTIKYSRKSLGNSSKYWNDELLTIINFRVKTTFSYHLKH